MPVADAYASLRTLIQDSLQRRQRQDKRYSLRKMAADLGLSVGALSELRAGRRRFSVEKATEIAMKLSPERGGEIANALRMEETAGKSLRASNVCANAELVPESLYRVMADWRYFAIIGLAKTIGFKSEVQFIADRLGLSVIEVADLIDELIEIKLLTLDKSGRMLPSPRLFRTTNDFPESLLSQRLRDGVGAVDRILAAKIEDSEPLHSHFGAFSTMALDPARLPEAKVLIEEFLKKLSTYLVDGDRREVFELSIHLFSRSVDQGKGFAKPDR